MRFDVQGDDGEYRGDLWHRPVELPLWYGRETPSPLTQHSITYGCMSIRQWHQYPNILPRELYTDELQEGGVKFDTL
ncbi:MAG: hypothetical protein IJ654_06955 [Bacteroidales bacterium]|nr:hypothetical protein [Bacteroidales bacterium]